MDDLKKLSVEQLRGLARKHLGKGHSRLRTRAQLLEALKDVVPAPPSRLRASAASVVRPGAPVRVVDFPPGRRGRVRGEPTAAEKGRAAAPPAATGPAVPASPMRSEPRAAPGAPGERRTEPRAAGRAAGESERSARTGSKEKEQVPVGGARGALASHAAAGRAGQVGRTPDRRPRPAPPERARPSRGSGAVAERAEPVPAEAPVEEAFFEAPAAPRRPRRVPSPAEPLDAEAFASPREVGTDAPLLLVRDPTTLFVFWDFRRELERGAALGLREPRLLLRIHRGDELERSLELSLGARSTYVTGLAAGEEYTAEVLLLGRDGWTRPVGSRSGLRRLPPGRVSAQLEVRTLRLPWSVPLAEAPSPGMPGAARHEPLDSPRRVPLPTSPGARGPEGGAGPSGGPRSGRA